MTAANLLMSKVEKGKAMGADIRFTTPMDNIRCCFLPS